jgi:hypothetical protein
MPCRWLTALVSVRLCRERQPWAFLADLRRETHVHRAGR